MMGGTPLAFGYPIFAAPAAPCPACTVGRLDDLAIALLARIVRGPLPVFFRALQSWSSLGDLEDWYEWDSLGLGCM
jgi:hypothetical protein